MKEALLEPLLRRMHYGPGSLEELFADSGLRIDRHAYFQLGVNNFLVATRDRA